MVYKETSERVNCKGQLALTLHGERFLRRIVCRQRSQTLGQITYQLNDGATVTKRTVQHSLLRMGFESRRSTSVPLVHAIGQDVLSGQESTNTGL
ncbi:HTH_Tnp_Tc3_2 domain-containing protein [Trichonephila clavipes]|uniref:HTH_Tnp_Tc3_2 domain-containing protein n=1 Tax=Trichonephila clavipes TaxID=2585209 RepID=A0A8X7BDZ6_TRICX|nr:HTH_Tnp_Tc3_2 domain-containing protein [Trichonephila clavipes]